jgi:hypothetical protein
MLTKRLETARKVIAGVVADDDDGELGFHT